MTLPARFPRRCLAPSALLFLATLVRHRPFEEYTPAINAGLDIQLGSIFAYYYVGAKPVSTVTKLEKRGEEARSKSDKPRAVRCGGPCPCQHVNDRSIGAVIRAAHGGCIRQTLQKARADTDVNCDAAGI